MQEASTCNVAFSAVRNQLQSHFRSCDLFSSCFACLGLITASIDYELQYAKVRTKENCEAGDEVTQMCRWMCLFFTVCAAIFAVLRFRVQQQLSNQAFPHVPPSWFLSAIRRNTILRSKSWKGGAELCIELLILAVFPYPEVSDVQVKIRERILQSVDNDGHFEPTVTCYRLSELLYVVTFLRLFLLIRTLLRLSQYGDFTAAIICFNCRTRFSLRFTLKAIARRHPQVLFMACLCATCCLFALIFRVFERPYSYLSLLDFDPVANCLWFSVSTLYTAPYGDYYAQTLMGRAVSFLQCCAAIIFVSVAKVFLLDCVDLTPGERRAYESIKSRKLAARVIAANYGYYKLRRSVAADPRRRSIAHSAAQNTARRFSVAVAGLKDLVGLSEKDAAKGEKIRTAETVEEVMERVGGKLAVRMIRLEMELKQVKALLVTLEDLWSEQVVSGE